MPSPQLSASESPLPGDDRHVSRVTGRRTALLLLAATLSVPLGFLTWLALDWWFWTPATLAVVAGHALVHHVCKRRGDASSRRSSLAHSWGWLVGSLLCLAQLVLLGWFIYDVFSGPSGGCTDCIPGP